MNTKHLLEDLTIHAPAIAFSFKRDPWSNNGQTQAQALTIVDSVIYSGASRADHHHDLPALFDEALSDLAQTVPEASRGELMEQLIPARKYLARLAGESGPQSCVRTLKELLAAMLPKDQERQQLLEELGKSPEDYEWSGLLYQTSNDNEELGRWRARIRKALGRHWDNEQR